MKEEYRICVVFLVERGYEKNFIQQQVDRVRRTPLNEALRDRPKKENGRIPFTVTYYLGLPNIEGFLRELHPVLHSSQRCWDANSNKDVPMVAFRRPKCLSDHLVPAQFWSGSKDEVKGTSKCNSPFSQICDFLCVARTFCSKTTGKKFSINYDLSCNSNNVIYL